MNRKVKCVSHVCSVNNKMQSWGNSFWNLHFIVWIMRKYKKSRSNHFCVCVCVKYYVLTKSSEIWNIDHFVYLSSYLSSCLAKYITHLSKSKLLQDVEKIKLLIFFFYEPISCIKSCKLLSIYMCQLFTINNEMLLSHQFIKYV